MESHIEEQRIALNKLLYDWVNESIQNKLEESITDYSTTLESEEKRKQNFRQFVRNK